MRHIYLPTATLLFLSFAASTNAQQPENTTNVAATTVVPKLVQYNGTFRPANGMPAQPMESVTLSVYREQTGGEAIWHEIQNVAVDADGHYSVLMGATQTEGMPVDLFTSGEPRWLGVQFNRPGEIEQGRTQLVSVPYALKASDADTLGGRPASAYLLAAGSPAGANGAASNASSNVSSTTAVRPYASAGTPGYIGMFVNSTDLSNSSMFQSGGNIGIGTTQPSIALDARSGPFPQIGMAQTTDYLSFFASDTFGPAIYWDPGKDMRFGKGGTGLYNPFEFVEQMRIQSSTGNVGIGTLAPASMLDVAGDINFNGILKHQGNTALQVSGSFGIGSVRNTTTGTNNTSLGIDALLTNPTGNNNIAIGASAASTVGPGNSNNIHIGSQGFSGDNATIRIGTPGTQSSFYVAGVNGATLTNSSVPVLIDTTNGQLGVTSSSRRYKEDIQDMGEASQNLMRLRPVTFRYKKAFADGSKPIQYGLIAEEVAEVYPDLVARTADGQIETVKYQVLDSMLLNEVQRQQTEISAQNDQLRRLEQQISEERQRNESLQERLAKLETALTSTSVEAKVSRDR